jgi:hypothetical protein
LNGVLARQWNHCVPVFVIESQWVSKVLAVAGRLRPQRLNAGIRFDSPRRSRAAAWSELAVHRQDAAHTGSLI